MSFTWNLQRYVPSSLSRAISVGRCAPGMPLWGDGGGHAVLSGDQILPSVASRHADGRLPVRSTSALLGSAAATRRPSHLQHGLSDPRALRSLCRVSRWAASALHGGARGHREQDCPSRPFAQGPPDGTVASFDWLHNISDNLSLSIACRGPRGPHLTYGRSSCRCGPCRSSLPRCASSFPVWTAATLRRLRRLRCCRCRCSPWAPAVPSPRPSSAFRRLSWPALSLVTFRRCTEL